MKKEFEIVELFAYHKKGQIRAYCLSHDIKYVAKNVGLGENSTCYKYALENPYNFVVYTDNHSDGFVIPYVIYSNGTVAIVFGFSHYLDAFCFCEATTGTFIAEVPADYMAFYLNEIFKCYDKHETTI